MLDLMGQYSKIKSKIDSNIIGFKKFKFESEILYRSGVDRYN